MLCSPDDTTRAMAVAKPTSVVNCTIRKPQTEEDMDLFLLGSMEGDLVTSGNSGQISTLWSRARVVVRLLK